ncbi:MAG: hypothetical protein J2P57_02625 [Acidimicrobiaceae bacterium]|nr:hypothetical protein [Acidimicrobiaceae bacterium]
MIMLVFLVLIVLFVVLPVIGIALWALISTIIVGLIIGGLGRLIVPGVQRIGFLATVAAGLCGAILGGFLGQHVFGFGRLATVLIEIGIAALLVVLITGGERRYKIMR